MTAPQIYDDDEGVITAEIPTRTVRSWSYASEQERRIKMLMAREFAEGWFQAGRAYGAPEPNMSQFEGM